MVWLSNHVNFCFTKLLIILQNEEQLNCAPPHVQHYSKRKVMTAAKRPVQYWFSAFCQHRNNQCHSHILDECIILIANRKRDMSGNGMEVIFC